MIDYHGMSVSGDYVRTAVESVPEEVLGVEPVVEAFEYLGKVIDDYEDNWIDPDSDYYRESLWEAEHQGAYAVAEYYRKSLEDALYRQKMFGTQFDLERFLEGLHNVSVQEVLDASR